MQVRDATVDDVPSITAIYNELIDSRTVTWTDRPDSVDDRARWLARLQEAGFPVLVAVREDDANDADDAGDDHGEVVGFAAYGEFRDIVKWPGYRFTAELTIHIDEQQWGRGVGRALMTELLARARRAGMHAMIAAVDGENTQSLAFHEKMGFTEVGRLEQTGFKFGRWLDLVFLQVLLDEPPA